MKDIMGMMGKVKEMQANMEALQTEMEAAEVSGEAGGGLVTVRLNGKGAMRGLDIDASLLVESEKEILEDLIVAAHNSAKARAEEMMQSKTADLTAGLPLPPGFKMPF